MMNQAVAKRYGSALLQIAKEQNALDKYQADLEIVVNVLEENEALQAVWLGKEFDNMTKKNAVKGVFDGKIENNIINMLCLIVDKGREPYVRDILNMFKVYADDIRNIAYAKVVSAYPLTAEQENTIAEGLSKASGRTIRLEKEEDKTILGGIKVIFGDTVYDGSVTARLQGLKENLQEAQI